MSLDVTLTKAGEGQREEMFSANVTHNLNEMATAAGLYQAIWRPEEVGITYAKDLIAPLTEGIGKLKAYPEHFKTFEPRNGWGKYRYFVPWLDQYLAACKRNPDACIEACR